MTPALDAISYFEKVGVEKGSACHTEPRPKQHLRNTVALTLAFLVEAVGVRKVDHVLPLLPSPIEIELRSIELTNNLSSDAAAVIQCISFLHCQVSDPLGALSTTMSQFRAKKLDIGGFINIKIIRDHTKRKTFEQFEPQR